MSPRKKWITSAIMVSCNTKEILYNISKRNPTCQTAKTQYTRYCKILNKVIKDAKYKFDYNTVKECGNNPKHLWNIINIKLGKNKVQSNRITNVYNQDNEKIEDQKEIANVMNKYFCEVGSELSKKIKQLTNKSINMPKPNRASMFLEPTDAFEINLIINNMKNKAGGVDSINTKTLKTLANYIIIPLEHVINLCIEKSIWPNNLKIAEVVPIYKAGKKSCISNYRPISLISNIAKIFEKIVYNRLYKFLQKHKILSDLQFGFVKNKGTTDALSYISQRIYENLDKSKPMIATFLDLSKAFDTVNHDILLRKLNKYGIRGNVLDLFASYLFNRRQKVRLQNYTSKYRKISCGVPQGTILGPLLFILYVNELLVDMPKGSILSYADDTVIISSDNTWSMAQEKMNQHLYTVAVWLALNKLSLNIQKTKYVTL